MRRSIGGEFPAFAEIGKSAINEWIVRFTADAGNRTPPDSQQHFDIWEFPKADQDAGAQSYFGALPPQVVFREGPPTPNLRAEKFQRRTLFR
jgi:hypothetical protein